MTGLVVGDNELVATMAKGPGRFTSRSRITRAEDRCSQDRRFNRGCAGPSRASPRRRTRSVMEPPLYSFVYMNATTHTFQRTTRRRLRPPRRSRARRPTRAQWCRTSCGSSAGQWTAACTTSRCSRIPPRRGRRLRRSPAGTTRCSTSSAVARPRGTRTERRRTTLIDIALSRGFLVANNNLNIRGDDANDVVSAEALMMLKEHIVESYGSIRYTIGTGCSGGSIQQHQIAANYPGLLDGIQPNCSFQDSWTTANEVNDCHLLAPLLQRRAGGCTAGAAGCCRDDAETRRCLHRVGL